MRIAIGCDPNATAFKKELVSFIESLGHTCVDYGSDDPIYANVAFAVGEGILSGDCERGILICGTGIGMSIAANKMHGIYAANISDVYQALRAQLSNNANIITMGSQVIGIEVAKCLVESYLSETYSPTSRSAPKVERIVQYEMRADAGIVRS